MQTHINILKVTRKNYLKELEGISLEQLNIIPDGFNNNLIWNAGHVVVTQQLLCYALAGQEVKVPKEIIERYRKGSKPQRTITEEEVNQIKKWLSISVDWLKKDLADGIFQNYKPYPTSYGITLESIQDAVIFNNVHEGMHLGYIIALKKHLKLV